jgi:hypothetical protein
METSTHAPQNSPAQAAVVTADGHHAALAFRRLVPVASVVSTPLRGRRPRCAPSNPRLRRGPVTEAERFRPWGSLHDR